MKHRSFRVGLLILGFAGAAFAQAQEATMPKINFLYRTDLEHKDDGMVKELYDGQEVTSTTMDLKVFAILLAGKVGENVEYGVRYQLLNSSDTSSLDYAWAKLVLTENNSFSVGKIKAKVYGWENILTSPLTPATSAGLAFKPFSYPDMFALENKYDWGTVTIQIAQDNDKGSYNTARKQTNQPAILFDYNTDIGGIKPILQYGVWDQGHSNVATAGVAYKNDMFSTSLDYTMDNRAIKGTPELVNKSSLIAFYADAKVGGGFAPFLHYSVFDTVQDGTDLKVNSTAKIFDAEGTVDADGNPAGDGAVDKRPADKDFTDNSQRMALGVQYQPTESAAWVTYLAYVSTSAKFDDPTTAAADEKTATENSIKIGVKGNI